MLRFITTISLGMLVATAFAQSTQDSIVPPPQLNEVVVYGDILRTPHVVDDEIKISFETKYAMQSGDLGAYLDRNGLANVNVNGAPGSASSVRSRGMASDHAVFYWEGIPVNSLSLGTCDVSLIPVFLFDGASFSSQMNTCALPGGNMGMSLNLQNKVKNDTGLQFKTYTSYNSLLNSFNGLDLQLSTYNEKSAHAAKMGVTDANATFSQGYLLSRTKLFYQNISNQFSYEDAYKSDRPIVQQNHNNGNNQGLTQDLSWNWKNNSLQSHLWLQKKALLLPVTMGKYAPGSAEQNDEFNRSVIAFSHHDRKQDLDISAAWFDEATQYRDYRQQDDSWLIASNIHSKVNLNTAKYIRPVKNSLELKSIATWCNQKVMNINYLEGMRNLQWFQLGSGMTYRKGKSFLEVDARQDFRKMKTNPAWTLKYSYDFQLRNLYIVPVLQVAYRFRVPDMNELFWFPGGNENLKPEHGMNYQFRININGITSKRLMVDVSPTIYYSEMSDWIQWVPGASGNWSPINYKNVRSKGLELPARMQVKGARTVFETNVRYNFTSTEWNNLGSWADGEHAQMIYTPEHVCTAGLMFGFKNIGLSLNHKYTSKRYTEEQNLEYRALPSYHLTTVQFNYKIEFRETSVQLSASVDNLFDTNYESVRTYAMPGRVYQLAINIEFNHKK